MSWLQSAMTDWRCSVATTSTKHPSAIKQDIRRVLDRMQVQYRETKSGFECIHMPSIDVNSVLDPTQTATTAMGTGTVRGHRKQGSTGSNETDGTRKSVARKSSKLSFGKRSRESRDTKEKELPSRPSGGTVLSMTPSSASSSFFHVSSHAPMQPADATRSGNLDAGEDSTSVKDVSSARSHSPTASKILPPIPRDFAAAANAPMPFPTGLVDPHVFESMGTNSLAVRFEVNIVKVSHMFELILHAIDSLLTGSVAAITRDPVPPDERRRVAIPHAGKTSAHRAEAVVQNKAFPPFSISYGNLTHPFCLAVVQHPILSFWYSYVFVTSLMTFRMSYTGLLCICQLAYCWIIL